uniref:Uncharacterized protein n=1 Tax=Cucumis sativus TaxID=3659 RepID=A0A0A0KFA9_CUCSA
MHRNVAENPKFIENHSLPHRALQPHRKVLGSKVSPKQGLASYEKISSGLVEISTVYEATNESEEAFKGDGRDRGSNGGDMVGKYGEARKAFEGAIGKLRGTNNLAAAYDAMGSRKEYLFFLKCFSKKVFELENNSEKNSKRQFVLLQGDSLPLFNMLRANYKSSLEREPLNELLDELAEKFYGVRCREIPWSKVQRNPLQEIFRDFKDLLKVIISLTIFV